MEVIEVTEREVEVIEVIERGPAGPTGATGPQGPAGAVGVTSVTGTAPIVSSGGTTPAISVTVGTGSNTVAAGNDSRIANIAANSITTAQGANSGGAGGTITMRGGITGSEGAGGNAGSINLRGSDDRSEGVFHGGSIDLSGFSGHGGSINSTGSSEGAGGSLNMSGNSFAGGSINTSGGGSGVGGSIDTSNDGGSINTRGTGSIGFGASGTRTTLTGTATANRAISLPDAGGTLALTTDIPSTFAASAITSGIFDNARVNFAAPSSIGNTTRNSGAFTTLSASNDMEITDATKGVILKSPNNTRYRLTVSNSGLPIFTALLLLVLAQLAPAQNVGMATDTNGTILTDRTNTLTYTNPLTWATNVVAATRTNLGLGSLATNNSVPSGAATTNSILTADGAGGSAFVVSRTQTVAMTNSAFRTNTTDNSTNNAQAGMVVNLDANSTYHFAYAFIITSSTTGGFGAVLRHSNATNGLRVTFVGRQGRPINVQATDITAATNGQILLQAVNFAGTNIVTTGTGILATGTASGTLALCWHQNTTNTAASELVTGSMMTVTKISP